MPEIRLVFCWFDQRWHAVGSGDKAPKNPENKSDRWVTDRLPTGVNYFVVV